MLGSELVPYPLEVQDVRRLPEAERSPNATIAVLQANDDFGQSYAETLTQLVKGTQPEDRADPGVRHRGRRREDAGERASRPPTPTRSSSAARCSRARPRCTAAQTAGWHPITYMSGTCVSKVLLGAAKSAANGVLSVTPLLDPADPKNATDPAMKLYKAQTIAKYQPKGTDPTDGIVAYGWTTAALLVKTLESAKTLDRTAVMETARTLTNVTDVGLEIPSATWNTTANDWFVGETFQFIQYDATAGHTDPIGSVTNDDGKTASLTPASLINQ